MDDAFFGSGRGEGKRGQESKQTPVIIEASTHDGALGYARMHVIEHVDNATIARLVAEDAAAGQTIKTDGWAAYRIVWQHGHQHQRHIVSALPVAEGLTWLHILAWNAKALLLGTFHGIGK